MRDEIAVERKEMLARDMMNLAAIANELGFTVVAQDMKDAAKRIKTALPAKNFSRPEDRWRWR